MNAKVTAFSRRVKLSEAGDLRVCEVGRFASRKYNGTLDRIGSDLKMGPGIIDIKPGWIAAIVENFRAGAHETVPFIDELHARGISMGDITDVYEKDGGLFIAVNWNDAGKAAIKGRRYNYLSLDVDMHKVSRDFGPFKMGDEIYPVLHGAALCNDPVYKDQKTLSELVQFSEKDSVTAGVVLFGENIKLSEENMKELFLKFIEAVKAALAGTDEAAKTEAKGYAEELAKAVGYVPEAEMTAKEALKASEAKVKTLEAENTKLAEKVRFSEGNQGTQLSELSTRLSESEKRNAEMAKSLTRMQFDAKYMNKKVTPVTAEEFFPLYMSDKTRVEKILDNMPDVGKPTGEIGHGGNVNLSNGGGVELETQFAAEVKKIQTRDGIQFTEAYAKAKIEKADMWSALNGR